ncbi:MAG: hypothetical protein HFG29_10675 [Eubacterium sp.]|nr:hypothetical protein [Eubacterium sp.]
MTIVKEQIRQIIADNNFTNVTDVYDYLSFSQRNPILVLCQEKVQMKSGRFSL